MTPHEAGDLVKRLLGAYPTQRQRMTGADIQGMTIAYTAALIDLEIADAKQAVENCIKTSEWIPTVAKIRAEVGELARGHRRTGSEAWGDVTTAILRFGQYRPPGVESGWVFEDRAVAHAVQIVGWGQICQADPRTLASCRRVFCDAYDGLTATDRKRDAVAAGGVAPRRGLIHAGDAIRQLAAAAHDDERPSAPGIAHDDDPTSDGADAGADDIDHAFDPAEDT